MPTTYPAPTAADRRDPSAMPRDRQTLTVACSASRAAQSHLLIARMLLAALTLQLFFAGLGVFGVSSFLPHVILGTVIVLGSFALPLIAWRGHLETTLLKRSWVLAGLMVLQGLLIDAGRVVPVVSALHPVNAMLLVLVTYSLAARTPRVALRQRTSDDATT